MNNTKQSKNESNNEPKEPIISRFSDGDTFSPRVVSKGDGRNPLDSFEE